MNDDLGIIGDIINTILIVGIFFLIFIFGYATSQILGGMAGLTAAITLIIIFTYGAKKGYESKRSKKHSR